MSKKDLKGAPCLCGGTFQETSIYDDWDGKLHCTKCAKEVERYQEEGEPGGTGARLEGDADV